MTTTTTTNDGVDPTNGVSRRDLLRRTAAGATAVSLGSAGLITQSQRAQAVPWVAVGVAAGGAILGWTISEIDIFGDDSADADDIADFGNEISVYSAYESAFVASRLDELRVRYGVDENGDHVNPQDNDLSHSLSETVLSEAARSWQADDSVSEAEAASRTAVRVQASTAIIGVVQNFNSTVSAIAPALYGQFDGLSDILQADGDNMDMFVSDEHEPAVPDYEVDPDQPDYQPVGYRDYSDDLPAAIQDIPDEDIPDEGIRVAELSYYVGGSVDTAYLLSPMDPISDIGSVDGFDGYTKPGDGQGGGQEELIASYDGSTVIYELDMVRSLIESVRNIMDDILDEIDQEDAVQTVYDGLNSGSVDPSDLRSGRELFRDLDPNQDDSRLAIELQSVGNLSDPGGTETTLSSGDHDEITGYLYPELSDDDIDLSEGDTLSSNDYEEAQFLRAGADSTVYLDGDDDIEIIEIHGADHLSYEQRDRISKTGFDDSETAERVESMIERQEKLEELIEELEGGLFGIGGLGGSNSLWLLAGGALAAYLLGR